MGNRIGAKEIEKRRREKNAAQRDESLAKKWFRWWQVPSDRFAFLVAVFTGVLGLVGIFQWGILSGQQDIMQGQLNLMGADERPWVSLENLKIDSGLAHDANGWQAGTRWHITVSYQLKNYGKTPATHVAFWGHIVPIVLHYVENGKAGGTYMEDELNSACNWTEFATDLAVDTGRIIFPGEEWPTKSFEIQGDEKIFTVAQKAPKGLYAGNFLVPVCVTYRSVYANITGIAQLFSNIPTAVQKNAVFGDDHYRIAEGYRIGKKSRDGIDLAGETVSEIDLVLGEPAFQATDIK